MEDWQNCPGYLLAGKSIDNVLASLRNSGEKQDLMNEILQQHLDKQDKAAEQQIVIVKKLFDKVDANKVDSDDKIEAVKTGISKLFWKLVLLIGGALVSIIGLLLWKLPDLIAWLSTFVGK